MRAPKSQYMDSGIQIVIDSLVSYWGWTTADGNVGGTTIVDDALANEPSYAGHQAALLTGGAWGQAMRITTHVGNTLTVGTGFTDAAGAASQVLQGTLFVVLKESWGLDFAAIVALLGAFFTLQETGGTLAATGGVDNVILVNAPAAVFKPLKVQIDLTNMQAGDSITVRVYYRITNGGNLRLKDVVVYTGVQVPALINVELEEANRWGFSVTLEQTAGVNRNYDWTYFFES